MSAARAGGALTLITRADCHLCEQMHDELRAFLGADATAVRVLDVDRDEELRRKYGHKVPVLLLDGEIACFGRFDRAEVGRLLRGRP